MTQRDVQTIIQALHDASDWQDSLSDAYHRSLLPCHRTRENTAYARQADLTRRRYLKLASRIRKANALP